ncbi:hypothetical protein HNR23_000891 [Nocardiopsis mwathae]|uniref:Uncharacterized protein n=1 Tax=Nocardiopsis mwathae TaxID=1472723 RepID=A0A7W9YGF9_9ACTN|nr:hypothetical protein [Nocardiopsis mwathae]MBB6170831.1 hypothetical protein [Nocardiopsis mwathae]
MSSKPQESKAGPLSADVKDIIIVNVIALGSMVLFAAMGLSITHVAAGL